ncbi:hypothetical protein J4E85_005351 [Alternaria conjuncta]|uniref:uncharacterized protein n=1 Tax=Alternaria conjuncta TaxID=181017 RepID=UPI00221F126F|nr:uncharacterized protein J4E85_005351 [Alternaria conjuncta]KAI4928731.1 hypothetical protein J4E85_005351 [Alternaria conjuncta]
MDSSVDTFRFLDLPKDIRLLVPSTALLLVNRLLCDEIRAYFGNGFPGQPITLVAAQGHCTFALRFLEALTSGHHLDTLSKENHGDAGMPGMPGELSKFTQMIPTRQLRMRVQSIDQRRCESKTSPLTDFDDTTLQKVYRLCVLRMRKETHFQLRVLFPNGKVKGDRDLRYLLMGKTNTHPEDVRSFEVTVVFTATPPPDAIPSRAEIGRMFRESSIDAKNIKLQWEAMTEQELDVWRTGRFYNYDDYHDNHDNHNCHFRHDCHDRHDYYDYHNYY